MRKRRNRKRRLSVQNLETRKLFAADVGYGDMTYEPEVSAEIGSVRPRKFERPTFGPIGDTCPPCELENHVEASTTPEPTESTVGTYREVDFTITIEPVNDTPFKFVATSSLTESYGEGVVPDLTETEMDSNLALQRQHLKASHDGSYDARHVADQPSSEDSRGHSVLSRPLFSKQKMNPLSSE
jgi:hypothetical protein